MADYGFIPSLPEPEEPESNDDSNQDDDAQADEEADNLPDLDIGGGGDPETTQETTQDESEGDQVAAENGAGVFNCDPNLPRWICEQQAAAQS